MVAPKQHLVVTHIIQVEPLTRGQQALELPVAGRHGWSG